MRIRQGKNGGGKVPVFSSTIRAKRDRSASAARKVCRRSLVLVNGSGAGGWIDLSFTAPAAVNQSRISTKETENLALQ